MATTLGEDYLRVTQDQRHFRVVSIEELGASPGHFPLDRDEISISLTQNPSTLLYGFNSFPVSMLNLNKKGQSQSSEEGRDTTKEEDLLEFLHSLDTQYLWDGLWFLTVEVNLKETLSSCLCVLKECTRLLNETVHDLHGSLSSESRVGSPRPKHPSTILFWCLCRTFSRQPLFPRLHSQMT